MCLTQLGYFSFCAHERENVEMRYPQIRQVHAYVGAAQKSIRVTLTLVLGIQQRRRCTQVTKQYLALHSFATLLRLHF